MYSFCRNIFLLLCIFCVSLSAKALTETNEKLEKITSELPFAVKFSTKEIKYIENLSDIDLEKLVKRIRLILESLRSTQLRNLEKSKTNFANQNISSSPSELSGPIKTSANTSPLSAMGAGQSQGTSQPGNSAPQKGALSGLMSGAAATQPMSPPPQTQPTFQATTPIDCGGKKIITVGFRGEPTRGRPNSSPGVDRAMAKLNGRVFSHTKEDMLAARDHVINLVRGKSKDEYGVVIVGHSTGANRAVELAQILVNQAKLNIAKLVVADVGSYFAEQVPPSLGPVAVGIFSGKSKWDGGSLNVGETVPLPDSDHFQAADEIEKKVECKK